jgi:hypothetical protein
VKARNTSTMTACPVAWRAPPRKRVTLTFTAEGYETRVTRFVARS